MLLASLFFLNHCAAVNPKDSLILNNKVLLTINHHHKHAKLKSTLMSAINIYCPLLMYGDSKLITGCTNNGGNVIELAKHTRDKGVCRTICH